MSEWIASLPTPVRHAAAAFIGTYVAIVVAAIVAARGVTGVDWNVVLVGGLDKSVLAAALTVAAMAVTPLTSAYGVGKDDAK